MTDQRIEDRIRAAFAQLRVAELPRVVPVGVAAARRTVRRRRFGTVAAVAGATSVVAVGVGYLGGALTAGAPESDPGTVGAPGATESPSPVPSPSWPSNSVPTSEPPDPGGVCDQGGANQAEEQALNAVDDGPAPVGSRYNTFFVDQGDRECGYTLFDTYLPRPATDSYLVRVWCGDQGGSARVTLRAGAAEATTTARCAMTEEEVMAGVGETVLAADSSHEIEVTVELEESAWADGARPLLAIEAMPEDVDLS
jgi:hypothetical protein